MLNASLMAIIAADYAGLIALFTNRLRDRELAQDLINEAFAESLCQLAEQRIADPSRFSGYVYRVAFNLLRNHRRRMDNRSDVRVSAAWLERLAVDAPSPEDCFEEQAGERIRQVVAELPVPRDRELIQRFYLHEQTKQEICRDLALAPAHFNKILFRARRRLSGRLSVLGFGPPHVATRHRRSASGPPVGSIPASAVAAND